MKMVPRLLKLLAPFAFAVCVTVASAQTLTWTNVIAQTLPGGNFGRGTNWSGDNLSGTATTNTPISGTTCTFDGTVPGPLFVYSVDGINGAGGGNPIGGAFGANGFTLHMTPTQTSPLTFYATNTAVGMGFNGISVDAGAGQLVLGDNTSAQFIATLRPSAGIHAWENDSSFPMIINPNFQIQNGGGNAHEINFKGTGDFGITNNLRNNNNAPVNTLQWDSTGTTTWYAGGAHDIFNDGGLGNVIINAGTIIIKSSGLLPITFGNSLQHNGTLLVLDSGPSGADTLSRAIIGSGPIQVQSGSWTLTSGASTFGGNWTLNGGELSANGTESPGSSGPLGEGGTISFNGGTLGFGPNNTFDYSPRFSTADGQAYSFDTAGQNVTFATGLIGNNTVTKIGPGTLTLAGTNTYTGLTLVSAGKLVFQGPKTGTAAITVVDGGALGVTQTNAQATPSVLNITNSTLEFNNVSSEATPIVAVGTLNASGTITINVNNGIFVAGHSYPLFSWTTGTAPAVNLGFLGGALGTLTTNGGNTIVLNVSALADNWAGTAGSNWKDANNWLAGGVPITYVDPTPVVFDDSALGTTSVTVDALVQPKSVVVNNSTLAYTITSTTGLDIGGTGNLTKNGSGTLTLSGGANTYTGISTFSGGIASVSALANGGLPSDIGAAGNGTTNIVFNGGTLQYTGNAVDIDRGFSIATGGGAIDASGAGALSLNKTGAIGLSGAGARAFTLTGTSTDTNTLAGTLGDQGGASSLSKTGPGMWILVANNTYSGVTTIGNGTLQLGVGGTTGSLGSGGILDNGALNVNRTSTLTISSVISGGGSVNNNGTGTLILGNNETYTGGTTVSAGTLQIGNGGATGSLAAGSPITNNSKLVFNTTGSFTYTGNGISGTGNVAVTSSGLIKAIGNNSYTGWTLIDTNATFQPSEGNQGTFVSSVVTNYGTFKLVRQDQATFGYSNNIVGSGKLVKDVNNNNDNDVTLTGTNTYTGGTFIAGGGIVLGDGVTPGAGSIVGNVTFTNSPTSQDDRRYLEFNHPEDLTFPGLISGTTGGANGNAGQVVQMGPDVLTLTANNTFLGGVVVTNGALQVGNGGTTGAIGNGNSTVGGTGRLIFNRSDSLTFTGVITGDGSVVQLGSGTLTLTASNTITGPTTVSNGTLVVTSAVNGDMNVDGGTLAAGGNGTVGTLYVGGSLNLTNGTLQVALNKSLAQSNTIVNVVGSYNYIGGSLKIQNVGPSLTVGDRFVIFNQPIANGHLIPIVSPAFTVQNDLETDGSVTVTSISTVIAPTIKSISLIGGTNVVISGTNNTGNNNSTYALLSSTNIAVPLSNWSVISSGNFGPDGNVSVTNTVGAGSRFFILRAP